MFFSRNHNTPFQELGTLGIAAFLLFIPKLSSAAAGTTTIVLQNDGLCLNISGASTSAGGPLIQWSCDNELNEQFTFTALPGGGYSIKAMQSGMCLDAGSGGQIVQNTCSSSDSQTWQVMSQSDGTYSIYTGDYQCMDDYGANSDLSNEIGTYPCNFDPNERFTMSGFSSASSSPPASVTIGSGSDQLVVNLSEDAYQGDAQFTVSVDGVQQGGTLSATASHSSGQSQTFTFLGNWGGGNHTVDVNFLNDAYGGSASTDRNLYVDNMTYDGAAASPSSASLLSNGSVSFSVTGASSVSADGTTVPPANHIVDSQNGVWTVSGGVVYLNGSTAGYSANVTQLLWYGGVIYQENNAGGWWSWTNGGWAQVNGDPRSSSHPSPSPSPTAISNPPFMSSSPIKLPGVNLSGGEFNGDNFSAQLNYDYVYPSNAELDYYASKGLKVIRMPFELHRVQPQNLQQLSTTELSELDAVVQYAASKGMDVILDPHDYGYMYDNTGVSREIGVDPAMPASTFADFWSRMAQHYLNQSNVIFGLMNEPHDQTATQWHDAAVAAVNAIRATGAKQLILIPGTDWTGAHSWVTSGNAAAWQGFTDSNFAYEVHQYLDSDSSGTHTQCSSGMGSTALQDFTQWAQSQGVRGFLGESGWSTDPSCPAEAQALFSYMTQNASVWYGYTYWAGGPWMGSYMYNIEPSDLSGGSDLPQMSILLNNL